LENPLILIIRIKESGVDYRQRTLKDEVSCTGIGLHTGKKIKLTVKPAPSDTGIKFIRKDLIGQPVIEAHSKNVTDTMLSTTISNNGYKICTIEHLMAAFFGLGIDNARVELDGPEVPSMDGSAAPFVFLLKSVGIKEQKDLKKFMIIRKTFKIQDGNRSICIYPSKELKITYTIDFDHPMLRNQKYVLRFSGKDFINEISRARTFGFLKDVRVLRENGLAKGGSLANAIVVDDYRILNEDGLRYADEFVRHKILDFIGDVAVLGFPVIGHFEVLRSGHFLNQFMLQTLMNEKKYWEMATFKNPEECEKTSVRIPVFGPLDPIPA
jgi:UDP-3-O-[3-hydroxymyristoyl] N-acetylglucosamine deacetylase